MTDKSVQVVQVLLFSDNLEKKLKMSSKSVYKLKYKPGQPGQPGRIHVMEVCYS